MQFIYQDYESLSSMNLDEVQLKLIALIQENAVLTKKLKENDQRFKAMATRQEEFAKIMDLNNHLQNQNKALKLQLHNNISLV